MPIATLLLAFIYLGEHISTVQAIGMGLILLSIFANSLLSRQRSVKLKQITQASNTANKHS
jgi:drug/metabolite transporter (DMT)-like permease